MKWIQINAVDTGFHIVFYYGFAFCIQIYSGLNSEKSCNQHFLKIFRRLARKYFSKNAYVVKSWHFFNQFSPLLVSQFCQIFDNSEVLQTPSRTADTKMAAILTAMRNPQINTAGYIIPINTN